MKSLGLAYLCICACAAVVIFGCGGGTNSDGGGGGGGNNPTPTISLISPASAPQGHADFTLTVTGSGFVSKSQVGLGSSTLATSFVSASSLKTTVPSSLVASQGSISVTVTSPSPGGGISNAVSLMVGNPLPVLSSIQPTSAMAGSSAVTLSLTGSSFIPSSHVEWNGTALTTTFLSSTSLSAQVPASDLAGSSSNVTASVQAVNPAPAGGASTSATFQVLAPLTYIRTINLPANDLVWDSLHSRLYASLPSTDTNGNSVVAIDPVTGQRGTPQPAGKDPDELALADDNSFLYAALDGDGTIARFKLPDLTPDRSFKIQLPSDSIFGQFTGLTLAVAPANPHTLAVRIGTYSASTQDVGGIAIFDDSAKRPNALAYPQTSVQDVVWGPDASVLYSSAPDTTGTFTTFSVEAKGVSVASTNPNLYPLFGNLHYEPISGLVYGDGGWQIDPAKKAVAGTFNLIPLISIFNTWPYRYSILNPLCVIDSDRGVVFFLGQTEGQNEANSGLTLEAFDITTHALLGTLPISGPTDFPGRFIRWGKTGLAFVTTATKFSHPGGGPIYLIDGSFVNPTQPAASASGTTAFPLPVISSISPEGAMAGSPGFTLTVKGSHFFPSSVITWSDQALQTTFVSDTELSAHISPQSTAQNATIVVSDAVTNKRSRTSLVFTVVSPPSVGTTIVPMNLVGCDVAWDSKSQQLLVPAISMDTHFPNTLVSIDPAAGAVAHRVQVASDPCALSVTDDGSYVYTAYADIGSVTRVSLPDLNSPANWVLPPAPQGDPTVVADVRAVPSEPHAWAASIINSSLINGGVSVYDDDVARPDMATLGGYLEWGANDTVLYGADPLTTGWPLNVFDVNGSGVTLAQRTMIPGSPPTGDARVHFDDSTGYLYVDSGDVYDPASGKAMGNYAGSGFVAVDSAMNRVFILGRASTNTYAIQSFNKATFARVGYLVLPPLVGIPVSFTRWGSSGLAILTNNPSTILDAVAGTVPPAGMLYILSDTSFVSSNSVPPATVQGMPPVHSFRLPSSVLPMHLRRNPAER